MKLRIAREELLTALQRVQGVVEKRNTMPILSNILLEAKPEGVDILATDLEIGMRGLYKASVQEPGSITLSARKLYEILKELRDGEILEYEIHPEDFGLHMKSNRGLKVKDAAESKEMLLEALSDIDGTPRETVAFNAGTALYAAGLSDSIADGLLRARAAIASGDAKRKLAQFIAVTQKLGSQAA